MREYDRIADWYAGARSPEAGVPDVAALAGTLAPGARILFTSADREETTDGRMNGVPFRYVSLGPARYRALLHAHALDLLDERADGWENYVYIARKRPR